jgi:predicted MPP superfamily phosphohydrolase
MLANEAQTLSEKIVFRRFFTVLAFGGAIGEVAVASFVLGAVPPTGLAVTAIVALTAVNRLAAAGLEREKGRLARGLARTVMAVAFAGMVCTATLVATAVVWTAARLAGALRVEAVTVGLAPATPEDFYGWGFRVVGLAALGLGALVVADGYLRGTRRLGVTRLVLPLAGLPAGARIRIVHLSDLHLGPLADRAALRTALAEAAALEPDLVCVTGDLVDSPSADLDAWIPELAALDAPHGVFAILGNHDRYAGATRVAAALRRHTGWRLLRDEVASVVVDGARLHLLGLEDRAERQCADGLPALVARVPADEPRVLLAHRPGVVAAAARLGLPLVLAGHTHAGQIAVPGMPRLNVARFLVSSWDQGTFREGSTVLHVSRGLGESGQAVRIFAPREVVVVDLVGPSPIASS